MTHAALFICALLSASAADASALTSGAHADTTQLRRELERIVAGHRGVVGISMRNLANGESLSLRGDETFPTASLIKVPVLVTLMDEVNRGRIGLREKTTMV